MSEKVQKYRCMACGEIVVPNPDGSCPVCGAPAELLVPVDERKRGQPRFLIQVEVEERF